MPQVEKTNRFFEFEVRAENNEQYGDYITGRPIVYNAPTDIAGYYQEVIERGALDNADLRDVRFLVGHDISMIPLARSRNNNANSTMQMSVDESGMSIRVELDIEGNPEAKSLYSAIKRGDVSGMSFMFTVDKDAWDDIDTDNPLRHIRHISRVFEVSAVAFPAYEGTKLEAASEGEALDSAKASLESARKKLAEERAAQHEAERLQAALKRLNKFRKDGASND